MSAVFRLAPMVPFVSVIDRPEVGGEAWDATRLDAWGHLERLLGFASGHAYATRLSELVSEMRLRYGASITAVERSPPVERLKGLRVHGYKSFVPNAVYPMTRFSHSRGVGAAHAFAELMLGAKQTNFTAHAAKRTLHAAYRGMVAGLLHDVGHSCAGHDGDYIIEDVPGHTAHEWRGVFRLLRDAGLVTFLERTDVPISWVVETIQECGRSGVLQSIADTGTYVPWDCGWSGMTCDPAFLFHVLESIEGVERNRVVLTDPEPIRALLATRAQLFERFYQSHSGLLRQLSLRRTLEEAVRAGVITPHDLEDGTDIRLSKHQRTLVLDELYAAWLEREEDWPDWFISAARLVRGEAEELVRWEDLLPDDNGNRATFETSYANRSDVLILPRCRPDAKRIAAIVNGEDISLKANHPMNDRTYVYRFKG